MGILKYTKMPSDAFEKLQLNAGILVDSFNPATGVIGNIIGATSGGIKFDSNPKYSDFGSDVDNCPENTMQLKHLDGYDPTMSGTFLTCTAAVISDLLGAADVDVSDTSKVVPREALLITDFKSFWWIGDYSDKNTGDSAGFLAIYLKNSLNTSGFSIQSGKNAKGTMSFEYHAHYDLLDTSEVPFEIYCKGGSSAVVPAVMLNKHVANVTAGSTVTLTAETIPASQTVTWTSGTTAKATVSNGTVTGVAAGSSIITASITVDGVTYTDTCTVIVAAAS